MCLFSASMRTRMQVPQRPEEGPGFPEVGITGDLWATQQGCWKPNSGPLQEQRLFLAAELRLSPQELILYFGVY